MSMGRLKRELHHPDPPQLWYQLREIVEGRTYLKHGIEVREGDMVLDIGANVGVAAAFFAEECGAGAVHSFEPVRPIFDVLRENLAGFPACIPHAYGLGSVTGPAKIAYYPNDWAVSGLHADPDAERAVTERALLNLGDSEEEVEHRLRGRFEMEVLDCELRTLSDAVRAESIDRVDLLKIDVEKAELEVLAGIEEPDWPSIGQVVAEVHLDPPSRAKMVEALATRGFEVAVEQEPAMAGTPIHMLYAVRG